MKKYYLKNRCVVCSDLCCITSLRCRKCQDKNFFMLDKNKLVDLSII